MVALTNLLLACFASTNAFMASAGRLRPPVVFQAACGTALDIATEPQRDTNDASDRLASCGEDLWADDSTSSGLCGDAAEGDVFFHSHAHIMASDRPSVGSHPPSTAAVTALLGDTLLSPSGAAVSTEAALAGKVVGLYFSASWCRPCREFTPKLAAAYRRYAALGKELEIVFLSADKSEEAFDAYFGDAMPWLALPYSERERKEALSERFRQAVIPTLVVLDEAGNTLALDEDLEEVAKDYCELMLADHPQTDRLRLEPALAAMGCGAAEINKIVARLAFEGDISLGSWPLVEADRIAQDLAKKGLVVRRKLCGDAGESFC